MTTTCGILIDSSILVAMEPHVNTVRMKNNFNKRPVNSKNLNKKVQQVARNTATIDKLVESSKVGHLNENSNRNFERNNKNFEGRSRSIAVKSKVIPIIQTRGMKAKQGEKGKNITQKEINKLLAIDDLNPAELFAGEEICNDGVEITVPGSDLDDFPDDFDNDNDSCQEDSQPSLMEPGEIESSGNESEEQRTIPSVVCHSSTDSRQPQQVPSKRSDKFAHL